MGIDINGLVQQVQSQIPVGQQYKANNQDQKMGQFQRSLPAIQSPQGNDRPTGKGASSFTYSPTSGQQSMGSPNPYPNTVGMGDNQGNQPMSSSNGKGKGF
jgi:hypothetical protein